MGVISHDQRSGAKPDRNLAMELARVTEAAALAASRLMGRGDEKAADQAAVDAMRSALNSLAIDGTVVIGEGERDEAPMLYIGEKVGAGGPKIDIALDPLEGTTITAKGGTNALAVIAMAEAGGFLNAPDTYMEKISVGPGLPDGLIDLDATPAEYRRALYRQGPELYADLTRLAAAKTGGDPAMALAELARWRSPKLPLGGDDLLAEGLAPGPRLGAILAKVEAWWLAQDFAPDRSACLAYARSLLTGEGVDFRSVRGAARPREWRRKSGANTGPVAAAADVSRRSQCRIADSRAPGSRASSRGNSSASSDTCSRPALACAAHASASGSAGSAARRNPLALRTGSGAGNGWDEGAASA